MSKRTKTTCPAMRILRNVTALIAGLGRAVARIIRRRQTPIEVVITDDKRRRALKREIARNLHRLQNLFGKSLPTDVVIVAAQVIPKRRQPAGCFQVGSRADGSRYAVIRLALQVNGHRLSTDEVLATLLEQCLGIVAQDADSVVVPVEFQPGESPEPDELPGDPLAPAA